MRILQVYKTSFPNIMGGVDAVVCALLGIQRENLSVALLSTTEGAEDVEGHRTLDGVDVYRLRFPLPPSTFTNLKGWARFVLDAPRSFVRLRRVLRAASVDLIHLHTLQHYHCYFLLASLLGGPPYVLTVHGSEISNFSTRSRPTKAVWRLVARGAARLSAVSRSLQAAAIACLPAGCRVDHIPNGISIPYGALPNHDDLRSRFALPARYCLIVGTLTEAKAQTTAIRAWSLLPASLQDVALLLVGDGGERAACLALARQLGLEDRIIFVGQVDHPATLALIRDGELMLIPSRREGFGLVVLEAGALGTPVVVSAIPAFRELVRDGVDGMQFAVDDPGSLAVAIVRLFENRELGSRYAATFRNRVLSEFDLARTLDQYARWYEQSLDDCAA